MIAKPGPIFSDIAKICEDPTVLAFGLKRGGFGDGFTA
jgi:hypothetical protein